MMVIAVAGGREYSPTAGERAELLELLVAMKCSKLVHGDARGVDREIAGWVRLWAKRGELPVPKGRQEFPVVACYVDERLDGKWPAAGVRRSRRMLATYKPGLLVAFKGGEDAASCRQIARSMKIPMYELAHDK